MWTEKTPAPRRECPHDVVGLRPHKGTMWMSNDRVPLKNIELPYGGGVSSLPGAAGDPPPVMFPVAPVLLAGGPQLGPWQVAVVPVDATPAGDSSEQEYPCATQNRHRPIDIYELPDGLAYTPWGNELLYTGRLNHPRNVMRPPPPNMIRTILWRALPHRAPGHWAPPQLCQVQVKLCHMPMHVALYPCAAVNTTTWLSLTKSFFWRPCASLPGPAVATPCDGGLQVATAGVAKTAPVERPTTQAHRPCRR